MNGNDERHGYPDFGWGVLIGAGAMFCTIVVIYAIVKLIL